MRSGLENDDSNPVGEIVRDGLFSLAIAGVAALGAWMLLPTMPGGEWAVVVRGIATLIVGAVVFGIGWFITVLLAMEEMGL